MRRRLCQLVALLLASSFGAGCRSTNSDRPPYPADPLLLSKKPAEEKDQVAPKDQVMLAAAEPAAPPLPTAALVQGQELREPIAAQLTSAPRRIVQVIPAVRAKPILDPTLALAHGLDHSWLQGILEKHYEGHFHLRFRDATAKDPWGGRVRLEDDSRLHGYQDGDLVRVEGTLLPTNHPSAQPWERSPQYRVRTIQRLRAPVW